MNKHILIIDDDRDMRYFLQQALSAAGNQVETAERGGEGLRKLLTEEFDLALIEMNMPEISGPNICRALRKHDQTRDLTVAMITGTPLDEAQQQAAKADYGADDFLFKPFTGIDLQKLLERAFAPKPNEGIGQEQPLGDFTLPLLLHRFYMEKVTGLLELQRGQAKKIIYIKDGYPIFVRSNMLSECLGRMLVKDGRLTQVDCDQSVEKSRETGRLQGTVLIEMGVLTPQDLQMVLTHQVTEKLLSTFAWRSGTWQLTPARDFKRHVTRIKLSPAALIMQGIERYWTNERLDDFLYPYRGDYIKQATDPKYRFQDIELNKRGTALFKSCLGVRTLGSILDEHPLARREVQRMLAALMISEMLERQATPEALSMEDIPQEVKPGSIDSELRYKILEDYKQVMGSDYFTALGISREGSTAEARRAYYRLAKEYHPDRYLGSGLSREMSTKINEMFQYITQAYTVLSDPEARTKYVEELKHGPKKKLDINQVIEAEGAFQEGRALLRIRRFSVAAKSLKRALELSPEEPEYMTSFAWALFKSAPENEEGQTQALEVLLASRELNPESDLTHLYLGHVYQAQKKERQAEKSFEMAVQANPNCTEALRELRLINLRREQTPQKGLFKKFLSKD